MYQPLSFTRICRIGKQKHMGDEWATYTKSFTLTEPVHSAILRVDADGVCGVYINEEFIFSNIGRMPHRICGLEITSKLRLGENKIKLVLGDHFFQKAGEFIRNRRGYLVHSVAAELILESASGISSVCTDPTWHREADDGITSVDVTKEITTAEYNRFWKSAAVWQELPAYRAVPNAVAKVVGADYEAYLNRREDGDVFPKKVLASNLLPVDGTPIACPSYVNEGETYVLYDFGQLEVGYTTIDYEVESDATVSFMFDYTESIEDFYEDSTYWKRLKPTMNYPVVMRRLEIQKPAIKGRHTLQLLRRRACRYLLVKFSSPTAKLYDCKVRRAMMPAITKGYFHTEEELFNQMWEVGKYTLQINRQHEFESCPRNEIKFFSGDGIMDALEEYYTFGNSGLVDASLSLTEDAGTIHYDKLAHNVDLLEYGSWQILLILTHYEHSGDLDFVNKYYNDAKTNIIFVLEQLGSNYLVYQNPSFGGHLCDVSGYFDYSSSQDRVGYKTYINAMFYEALVAMCKLGSLVGEEEELLTEWARVAEEMKIAINTHLWSDEAGGYIDTMEPEEFPQDGNAMALLFGIADPERTKIVLDTLKNRNWTEYGSSILLKKTHPKRNRGGGAVISPMMNTFEAEVRFRQGDDQDALDLMRRTWGTMLRKGAHTFWEFAPNDPDDLWPTPAHAWSAGCNYLIGAYILGIRNLSPDWKKLSWKPCGEFASFEGVVPAPCGMIGVSCRTEGDKKSFMLALPEGIEVDVKIPDGCSFEITRY